MAERRQRCTVLRTGSPNNGARQPAGAAGGGGGGEGGRVEPDQEQDQEKHRGSSQPALRNHVRVLSTRLSGPVLGIISVRRALDSVGRG